MAQRRDIPELNGATIPKDYVALMIDIGVLKSAMTDLQGIVREIGVKVDKQDNLKREDLLELRNTIIASIVEMRTDLQKQIDKKADQRELDSVRADLESKADQGQVTDLKSIIQWGGGILASVVGGMILFYLTTRAS